MRVTHVIFNLKTGGTELMLLDIIAEQQRQGAEVSLLVINAGHDNQVIDRIPHSINTLFLNRPIGSKNPLWLLKYNRMLNATRPQVVHFHNDKSIGMTWQRHKVNYCATVHDTNLQLQYTIGRVGKTFAISNSVRDDLLHRYNFSAHVVFNGIKLNGIKAKEGIKRTDTPSPFKIVQVGRLDSAKKGQHLLLQAVAKVQDKLNITVDFMGDGASRDELENMATNLGISEKVKFHGLVDRDYIYSRLPDYDLFVQPSLFEGFGLTVAEAMAAKVPVLVSDIEGPMEVIDNGTMGSYFKTGDVDDLSDKIHAIACEYQHYLTLAQCDAYEWVNNNFNIEATAANYLKAYGEGAS